MRGGVLLTLTPINLSVRPLLTLRVGMNAKLFLHFFGSAPCGRNEAAAFLKASSKTLLRKSAMERENTSTWLS